MPLDRKGNAKDSPDHAIQRYAIPDKRINTSKSSRIGVNCMKLESHAEGVNSI
jgi:hypothetical protein